MVKNASFGNDILSINQENTVEISFTKPTWKLVHGQLVNVAVLITSIIGVCIYLVQCTVEVDVCVLCQTFISFAGVIATVNNCFV